LSILALKYDIWYAYFPLKQIGIFPPHFLVAVGFRDSLCVAGGAFGPPVCGGS